MPEQTWSPDPEALVIEYRPGRWVFIGGLAMFVVFGLVAIFPDVGHPSAASRTKNISPTAVSVRKLAQEIARVRPDLLH